MEDITSYRLQILVNDGEDEDNSYFVNLYLDVPNIMGFYLSDETIEYREVKCIVCLIPGGSVIVKHEPHIEKYLLNRFCKDLVMHEELNEN